MNQHEIITKYITGLSKDLATSLIVVSRAGLGKTETTLNVLKKKGCVEGQHYLYRNNYITPKALVHELEEVNSLKEPKILVLDDIEDTLKNLQAIGVLKGALWGMPNGERRVSWITTKERIEFNFTGKIIFLLNVFKKENPLIEALRDRGFYYNFDLNNQEIIELIDQRSNLRYHNIPQHQRKKIVDYLRKISNGSSKITLRLLPKAYNLYLLSPNHFKRLILELL